MQSLKKFLYFMAFVIVVVVAGVVVWVTQFEAEPPLIKLLTRPTKIGGPFTLKFTAQDPQKGLRRVRVAVIQDRQTREVPVLPRLGPPPGGEVGEVKYRPQGRKSPIQFKAVIDPKALGLENRDAVIVVQAWDRAWANGLQGNEARLIIKVMIDTEPPFLTMATQIFYLARGGAGLLMFRTDQDTVRTEARVDGGRFIAYRIKPLRLWQVMVACPMAFRSGWPRPKICPNVIVTAWDRAGNPSRVHLVTRHRVPRWADRGHGRVKVSNEWLARIVAMAEYRRPGIEPVQVFRRIWSEFDRDGRQVLRVLGRRSGPRPTWNQVFIVPLAGGLPRAKFGHMRSYIHKDRLLVRRPVYGVDFVSRQRRAPVLAANDGRVVLVGFFGPFGQTVVLDHGLGLLSLYGHLSRAAPGLNIGDRVKRGQVIGRTGRTGVTSVEKLHFAMVLGGIFVDPYEWWDWNWIKLNVADKYPEVGLTEQFRLAPKPGEAQPAPAGAGR
jgi:hypothetical protein